MSEFIRKHKTGIICTLLFHIIIGAIFMIFGYSTPLPLPGEEGILINFGNADDGFGIEESMYSEAIQEQVKEEVQETQETTSSDSEDGLTTQDFEDAPAVHEQGQKEKTEDKKPEPKPEPEKEEKVEEKEERKVNENALFPGRNRNTNSNSNEGETAEDQGNQGSTTGSIDSQNHSGGNSMGNNGTEFNLKGRNQVGTLPKPSYNEQIEGKVVVEITVDKYGTVTNAVPGVKGSTTLDATLLAAAKRAALKARFDKKPDAAAYQKGTITYYFKLQ